MKKVLSIVAVAALSVAFLSCGPSKEELAAKAKAQEDSIAAANQVANDSLAKVAEMEAAAAATADSLAKATAAADSLAKAAESTKGAKKTH
jgi:hypothetical protein